MTLQALEALPTFKSNTAAQAAAQELLDSGAERVWVFQTRKANLEHSALYQISASQPIEFIAIVNTATKKPESPQKGTA